MPRQALLAASQAPNFEATLRESRAEDTIVAPALGSEQATVTASEAAGSEGVDTGFVWVEDNYEGFDWSRYPNHCRSSAYYVETLLHPRYKHCLDVAWAEKPDWLESSDRNFQALWAKYESLPKPRVRPTMKKSNNIDDAIDCYINPAGAADNEEDEYESWKRSEPVAKKGSPNANNPIKYWVGLQDSYANLSKFAINMLSIPGSSCECERLFSELGDLLEPRQRNISPRLLAAIQCVRRWIRAGFWDGKVIVKDPMTVEEMDAKYGVDRWETQ